MKTVTIVGWSAGFQKVRLTDLLRQNLGYTLSEAKAATDSVLDNQRVKLQVQDSDYDGIVCALRDLRAVLELEEGSYPPYISGLPGVS